VLTLAVLVTLGAAAAATETWITMLGAVADAPMSAARSHVTT